MTEPTTFETRPLPHRIAALRFRLERLDSQAATLRRSGFHEAAALLEGHAASTRDRIRVDERILRRRGDFLGSVADVARCHANDASRYWGVQPLPRAVTSTERAALRLADRYTRWLAWLASTGVSAAERALAGEEPPS